MRAIVRNRDELGQFFLRVVTELGQTFNNPQSVVVTEYHPPRSLLQNAKLHAMIGELANHIGYSADELKEWLKLEYGPRAAYKVAGKVRMIPKSSALYTKVEMAEFIDHVYRIAAEAGYKFKEDYAEH